MAITPVKTPFTNMSFTPDVPSSSLGPQEYNAGYNVETDVRSVKSVAGDQYILSQIPGNIIFVTGGFLAAEQWSYIVATEQGSWFLINNAGFANITPTPTFGVISNQITTFNNLTGNISINGDSPSQNIYLNVPQKSTSGSGYNALFDIELNGISEAYSSTGTLQNITTFSNFTGTSSSIAANIYSNVTQKSTTGTGTGATFLIGITGNSESYAAYNSIYSGTNLTNFIGYSGNTAAGSYTNLSQLSTSGSGTGATFNVQLVGNAEVYSYANVIYNGTTFTSLAGNAGPAAVGTYTNVPQILSSGTGQGATFNVTVGANANAYSTSTTIVSMSGGHGYHVGDTVTLNGASLGGNIIINNLTFTISNATANAATTITSVIGGQGYKVGDTITIGGNNLGGAAGTNNLTFTLTNSVANVAGVVTTTGGRGYKVGDNVTIAGTSIGGATPANDFTFTIGNQVGNATVIVTALGGANYNVGDTITISGNNLGGTSPANDLTFTLGNSVQTIPYGNFSGYSANTVITSTWNGTVVFFNDMINPPMYYQQGYSYMALYDNPNPVSGQTYVWNYDVTVPASGPQAGNIVPLYSSLTSGFVRDYNSPNVGSLLISGNLTGVYAANVTVGTPGTIQNLPTTVRWSQNFGLNSGPLTWAPTISNLANEVEIPVRGPVIDGYALNGNFYVHSYWDCVLFAPIAYTSTSAPLFGISKVTDGRGLINENCFAVVDTTAYGVDARDFWTFNGGAFTPIGDQKIKNYFYTNLNPLYTNQINVVHNSKKYQVEYYYPDLNSTGYCNQMLSYRYDLQIWNPPRQVNQQTQSCEAPIWTGSTFNLASRTVVYSSAQGNVALVQKDQGTSFLGANIASQFQRNNISFGQDYSASIQVHRVYPEVYGTGNINVTVGGADSVASAPTYESTQSMPIVTSNPWVQIDQNEARITSIKVEGNSAVDTWQMSAANWQITKVQDTR